MRSCTSMDSLTDRHTQIHINVHMEECIRAERKTAHGVVHVFRFMILNIDAQMNESGDAGAPEGGLVGTCVPF